MIKEVGPLVLDDKIQEEVRKIAENDNSHQFATKIDSISLENCRENLEFPNEGFLEIGHDSIKIIIKPQIELISWQFEEIPKINMIRKSNNIYEIYFNDKNSVKLSAKNNIERDIIGMTVRMISGEKLLESFSLPTNNEQTPLELNGNLSLEKQISKENHQENEKCLSATLKRCSLRKSTTENYEVLIKMEHLNREVMRHMKEKEALKQEEVVLVEKNQALELGNKDLRDQLAICTKNYYDLDKENEDLKKKMESFMNQKLFFLQEIDIYKAESFSKDEIIDKLKKEMNKLMPSVPNKRKLTWVEVEDLKKNVEDLTMKLSQTKKEKIEICEKFERNQEISEEMVKKYEEMLNEINYYKKKYESLKQEKAIIIQTPKKENLDNSFGFEQKNESFTNSLIKIKENIKEKTKESSDESDKIASSCVANKGNYQPVFSCVDEENKKLKDQIKQLEITIET